jgi:long-chain acyl-CoA synthetase
MGSSITHQELKDKSTFFAAYLQRELGLKKGDRMAVMMPNTLQYMVALLGAFKAGVVLVNVNPLYTSNELIHQILNSGAQTILVLENFAHTVSEALPKLNLKHVIVTKLGDLLSFPKGNIVNFVVKYIKRLVPRYHIPGAKSFLTALSKGEKLILNPVQVLSNDIAFLQYTGGTTGVSKGAILTHRNLVANILQGSAMVGNAYVKGESVVILPLPLYHIYSLTVCFALMHLDVETVLITNPKDIAGFVKELKGLKFDGFFGLNTLFHALLNNPNFQKLKFPETFYTFSGGMACKESVANEWKKVTGSIVLEGYGLTETSPGISFNLTITKTFNGTVGLPVPSIDVDIRDENGKSLQIGEEGEICVKGPNISQGYWMKPEENEKAFTADGWFKTGDIGKLNPDGTLKILDRKKDMIIVGGFNVYPNEVEEVLMYHEGILEAAVVGENDEHSGEVVKAFIVKKDPKLTESDIKEHCKKYLTGYKRPSIIVFTNELPKSVVGKILRVKLRNLKDTLDQKMQKAA